MATVGAQTLAAYRPTHSPSQLAWSEGWQHLVLTVHSSNEPSELWQWPCHSNSTINIVIIIIISSSSSIIIIIICCYCPSTASFSVQPYCKNARRDRCQEYHNCFPFGGLEETTRTSSNYVDEDYPARLKIKQSLTG